MEAGKTYSSTALQATEEVGGSAPVPKLSVSAEEALHPAATAMRMDTTASRPQWIRVQAHCARVALVSVVRSPVWFLGTIGPFVKPIKWAARVPPRDAWNIGFYGAGDTVCIYLGSSKMDWCGSTRHGGPVAEEEEEEEERRRT